MLYFTFAGALRHSLQDRLSKSASGKGRDQIYLKLRTNTGLLMDDDDLFPPIKYTIYYTALKRSIV